VLMARGGQWWLPADRPVPPVYNATGSERQKRYRVGKIACRIFAE
jgi:hypothetical protein